MNKLSDQFIENVFPEERNKFFVWLKLQKRNLRSWLIALLLFVLFIFVYNFQSIIIFLYWHLNVTINLILFFWIITLAILPFIWPIKPGDIFFENFKFGLNPKLWNWEGNWRTEIDENGKPVLSVTQSNAGGIVTPCLHWTDYELIFETRIINECTGWIVRASDLNNYVMFQLNFEKIRPHIRASGAWPIIDERNHELELKQNVWYSIKTIVRGSWVSISITIDGKPHQLFQEMFFSTKPPIPLEIRVNIGDTAENRNFQLIDINRRTGSFGFRLDGNEMAQFRNIRAYALK